MSWKMKISDFVETEAEISVAAHYFDDQNPETTLHVESASFPVSTTAAEIKKELARRGRSRRKQLADRKPPASMDGLVGEILPIDGV